MSTKNNLLDVKEYQKQYRGLIRAVFEHQAYFRDFFGGSVEALDGVENNEEAFYVKTSNIPVALGKEYDKSEDVAFGSGTGNSTRFGERTEVIYEDTPVKYKWGWVFHEGIDKHTVNNNEDDAVADRLDLQAVALTERFNDKHSEFISESAGKEITAEEITEDSIAEIFTKLARHYRNKRVVGQRVANVNTVLYNKIIEHPLTTSSKSSSADIDGNTIYMFKSFVIRETPDDLFQDGEVAYTYVANIARAFTGINTTRTIPSEDFDGKALQGAGKAGEFIPEDNKQAVAKVSIEDIPEG